VNPLRNRLRRDERGATLIFAIGFLVVIGAITAAALGFVTSGITQRGILDTVRNRQYAADAAVENVIAQVRNDPNAGTDVAANVCPSTPTYDNVKIRVTCTSAPQLTVGLLLLRNVVFSACVDDGSACTNSNTILRAEVNFAGASDGPVTGVTIQSWSVNQ
jgi:Tfp pilus assembly protein PilX